MSSNFIDTVAVNTRYLSMVDRAERSIDKKDHLLIFPNT